MIRFCSLSSGSSGNSVFVGTDKSNILIDAGFSGKKTEDLLKKIGVRPQDLDYILITHEHIDHVKGVGVLSRRYDIPLLANKGTWLAMKERVGKIKEKNIEVFETDRPFSLMDMDILPIHTYHDAEDPVAFIINIGNKKLTVMTDTGKLDRAMVDRIAGSDAYYFEANHDEKMLINGPYPRELKERIKSSHGHLSNMDSAKILGQVLDGRGERVLLAHMSVENNRADLCLETVEDYLMDLGFDPGRDLELDLSPRYKPSRIIEMDSGGRDFWNIRLG